jgi:hypothetical protein
MVVRLSSERSDRASPRNSCATPVEGINLAFSLAKSKSRQRLNVSKEARRRAREQAGLPPAERIIPDKRRRPPKHKRKLLEEELL